MTTEDESPILEVALPTVEGETVTLVISEDMAAHLEELFTQTWGPVKYTETTDDLVQLMHDTRDTPYPTRVDPWTLAKYIRVGVDAILEGKTDEALTGLAALIDTLENFGRPEKDRFQ